MCLEKIVKSSTEFIPTFSEQIKMLLAHDFIAKKQSEFLKKSKNELQLGEFVVISDFAENYTFVIQVIFHSNIINILPLLTLIFIFLI